MRYLFGIYGCEITKPVTVPGFRLIPRFSDCRKAHEQATDRKRFNLTALGELAAAFDPHRLHDLVAALTFCQQQWVVATDLKEFATLPDEDVPWNSFLDSVVIAPERQTQGSVIGDDAFYPGVREGFLIQCIAALADESFERRTGFRSAFYRHVESWRLQTFYVDITYYLDFSALEILARANTGDYRTRNVAQVLTGFLRPLGFDVVQDDLSRPERAMQTYADLRNAIFHEGRFEAVVDRNGASMTFNVLDFEEYLRRLVPEVLIKVLGYSDGHIRPNSWLDRNPRFRSVAN